MLMFSIILLIAVWCIQVSGDALASIKDDILSQASKRTTISFKPLPRWSDYDAPDATLNVRPATENDLQMIVRDTCIL